MDIEMTLLELEEHMQKSLEFSLHEFASIRTGKASPSMVEGMDIHVISYGVNMKLKQLASITTPEPRLIVVEPFDAGNLKDIERGLRDNRMGLSPVTYGKLIRLHVPDLTQERRKELAKYLKEKNEEGKVRLRGHRRDAMEAAKKAQKAGAISEDDLKGMEESIQEITDKYVKEMESHAVKKEAELMHV